MQDERSAVERLMWEKVGPPLYYCAECLRGVRVTPVEGGEPIIKRQCAHTGGIIAPRSAICTGKGGASVKTKAQVAWSRVKAAVTGRCA